MTKLTYALAGLAVLGGLAMASGTASAMPASPIAHPSSVENVRLVCDAYGRCWHRPSYYAAPRYYAPRVYAPRVYAPRYYGSRYGHRGYGHRW